MSGNTWTDALHAARFSCLCSRLGQPEVAFCVVPLAISMCICEQCLPGALKPPYFCEGVAIHPDGVAINLTSSVTIFRLIAPCVLPLLRVIAADQD